MGWRQLHIAHCVQGLNQLRRPSALCMLRSCTLTRLAPSTLNSVPRSALGREHCILLLHRLQQLQQCVPVRTPLRTFHQSAAVATLCYQMIRSCRLGVPQALTWEARCSGQLHPRI